jgi:hypothetical protein
MYVNPQPLTFADLSKAVQRDAGLGQTVTDPFGTYDQSQYVDYGSAASLPLSTPMSQETNPTSPNYNPYTTALVAAGTTASTSIPWSTVGLFGLGIFVLYMVLGRKG